MKRKVLIFCILTILCMLCSCGNHKLDKELAQVDSLADVDLEAAKAIFDSIADYIEDDTKSNRMYFKLLKIKIAEKSREDISTDKEIDHIVSYFEGEKDMYRRFCMLLRLGISFKDIATLNNSTIAAVYVTSRRLGAKVRGTATTPTQWSEYINSI